jgi:pilus assembly protein Flp/PilA
MDKISAFLKEESGAAAAEYVLILAIIGGALATAAVTFGASISDALTTAATYLDAHHIS